MNNDKEVLPDFEPRAEKRIRGTLPALLRPPNIFHRTGVFLGITGTPPKDWKAIYNCDDIIVLVPMQSIKESGSDDVGNTYMDWKPRALIGKLRTVALT
jgi:hypothetical protein